MKQLYDLHGKGHSIRQIAEELDVSRNTVRKYLRAPGVPQAKPKPRRGSRLDPFKPWLREQLAADVDNCVVLLRELRSRGYTGGYSILKEYVSPFRRSPQPKATIRFETEPGEQAQVDFGLFRYQTAKGTSRSVWAFVLVLSWSRALYVEFVERADTATFIRCHVHAFRRLGGLPRRCLYDNTKAVVLGRDDAGQPIWNTRFLDFALRVGFEIRLCRPYRAQTKGRVESGVKYVRRNFWPTVRFTDLVDLNKQTLAWVDGVADRRVHGTTGEHPADQLVLEQPHLQVLPAQERLAPFLREERKVGRDGFVQWERGWYGVDCALAGRTVEVQPGDDTVELWTGDRRLGVFPRATHPGQRFVAPGQWTSLKQLEDRPRREPLAVEVSEIEVERRSLNVYAAVAEGVGRP